MQFPLYHKIEHITYIQVERSIINTCTAESNPNKKKERIKEKIKLKLPSIIMQ